MQKFTLTATYIIEDDLKTNVCLKPSNPLISDYIASYKIYDSEDEAIINIPLFIEEMTPLLFYNFKQMDNVPIEIRDQFEL